MVVTDITSTSITSSSGACWGAVAGVCDLLDHANTHTKRAANSAQKAIPGKATKKKGAMNAMNRHAILRHMKREIVSGIALAAERMISMATYTEPTISGLTKKKATSASTCSQRSGCFIYLRVEICVSALGPHRSDPDVFSLESDQYQKNSSSGNGQREQFSDLSDNL